MREAAEMLAQLLPATEARGWTRYVIEILALQALVYQAKGDLSGARTALARALALAEAEGYVRIFVDEGAPMAALLARGLGVGDWGLGPGQPSHDVRAYAHKLLAVFQAEGRDPGVVAQRPTSAPRPPAPALEPLTERELEVLRLLAQGRSNQAIAQELIVAVGTVKRHVNSIMSKLHVQSRLEAVARARDLDLV